MVDVSGSLFLVKDFHWPTTSLLDDVFRSFELSFLFVRDVNGLFGVDITHYQSSGPHVQKL